MKTIAHIHPDATISWDDIDKTDDRLLADCGDVILNLRDVWDSSQFLADNVLERWAKGWGFALDGIPVPDAVRKMHFAFIFPTLADLVPEYAAQVEALRGVDIPEGDLSGPLAELLDFPVRVNGGLLRHFLCDVFDGPFTDDEVLAGALMLRSA